MMRIVFLIIGFFFLFSCGKAEKKMEKKEVKRKEKIIIFENFDDKKYPGSIWENFTNDKIRAFSGGFSDRKKIGEKGYSLYFDYDYENTSDTIGGLWIDVSKLDFSKISSIGFWVKGEKELGYSRVISVSLENKEGERANFTYGKVTSKWGEVRIPISYFRFKDKSSISEMNIVIEKQYTTSKKGRIYIDNLYFVIP
jgi:hypothetical protein